MSACPICGKPARPRADNPSSPFCSARCKTVDLGGWLNEAYRVPAHDESATDGGSENAENAPRAPGNDPQVRRPN